MKRETKLNPEPMKIAFATAEKTIYFTVDQAAMATAFEVFLMANSVTFEKEEVDHTTDGAD